SAARAIAWRETDLSSYLRSPLHPWPRVALVQFFYARKSREIPELLLRAYRRRSGLELRYRQSELRCRLFESKGYDWPGLRSRHVRLLSRPDSPPACGCAR